LRADYRGNDGEEVTERTVNVFGRIGQALRKEVGVPTFLIPPRGAERDNNDGSPTTTLASGYLFTSGISLLTGNIFFPATFIAFLHLSRRAQTSDFSALIAATLTTALAWKLLPWTATAGSVDPILTNAAFVVGLAFTGAAVVQVG